MVRVRPNREQQEEEDKKEEKVMNKQIHIHIYTEGSEGEDEEHKT